MPPNRLRCVATYPLLAPPLGTTVDPRFAPAEAVAMARNIAVVQPGGTITAVTSYTSGNTRYPSWSPDAGQLVYATTVGAVDGLMHLRIVNADGTGDRPLVTMLGSQQIAPRWSPAGDLIVFDVLAADLSQLDLWAVRPDGGGAVPLTADHITGDAAWFPDGAHLVYAHDREVRPTSNLADLYTARVHPAQPVLEDVQRLTTLPGSADFPTVSANAQTVAFELVDESGAGADLWTVHADGSSPKQLTDLAGLELYPSWRACPDNQQDRRPHGADQQPDARRTTG